MKLKDKGRIWLPRDAGMDDIVLGATLTPRARRHIMLKIRKKNKSRDSALLIVPSDVLETALTLINANSGFTLKEIGELDI